MSSCHSDSIESTKSFARYSYIVQSLRLSPIFETKSVKIGRSIEDVGETCVNEGERNYVLNELLGTRTLYHVPLRIRQR